jgi:hypothetical protein
MLYRSRVIDRLIEGRLASSGAVLIEGPKACGKTFTAEQHSNSAVFLDLDPDAMQAIATDPSLALHGAPPQLIDEWQLAATTVWNYVRNEVNRRGDRGQFILTGSAVPSDDALRHTGAGRIARLRMRPMSLFESDDSSGHMSLAALMSGERPSSKVNAFTVSDLAGVIVRGGWPLSLSLSPVQSSRAMKDYLRNIVDVDLSSLDGVQRDPRLATRLLRALARNTAQDHKVARLVKEAHGSEGEIPARTTAMDYLGAFERLLILELQPAWSTHLRSRAQLRNAARTHFVDPSLAASALGAGADSLLRDLNTLGFLFESLAVRDTRIYAEPIDGEVFHYRDSNGAEVDIIVQTATSWGAFEVKLGSRDLDLAASNLLRFAQTVDTERVGLPAVLAVITVAEYAYTRKDGVVVIPINSFGP